MFGVDLAGATSSGEAMKGALRYGPRNASMTDLSGAYSDIAGKGTIIATQMAIDDFIAKEKPALRRSRWSPPTTRTRATLLPTRRASGSKSGVDVTSELVTTSVALAVQKIAKDKNRIALISGAARPASPTKTATT